MPRGSPFQNTQKTLLSRQRLLSPAQQTTPIIYLPHASSKKSISCIIVENCFSFVETKMKNGCLSRSPKTSSDDTKSNFIVKPPTFFREICSVASSHALDTANREGNFSGACTCREFCYSRNVFR